MQCLQKAVSFSSYVYIIAFWVDLFELHQSRQVLASINGGIISKVTKNARIVVVCLKTALGRNPELQVSFKPVHSREEGSSRFCITT